MLICEFKCTNNLILFPLNKARLAAPNPEKETKLGWNKVK